MIYIKNCLPSELIGTLCTDVLLSYNPSSNQIDLQHSIAVEQIRRMAEIRLKKRLCYFRAYLFLVVDTTIHTANMNASGGWHTDGSCSDVTGDCFNAWIPLYNSSQRSGIQVISAHLNPQLYEALGEPTQPLRVIEKACEPDIFQKIPSYREADVILVKDTPARAVALKWDEIVISSNARPVVGDLALFQQTEIHRGFHEEGVRIQLSLKFIGENAVVKSNISHQQPTLKKLSKHGRLEAILIRELLGKQICA